MDATTPQPGELTLTAAPALVEAVSSVLLANNAITPALLAELAKLAAIEDVALTAQELGEALLVIGTKYNFGLPPGTPAPLAQQEKFYRALQLPDLALAQACARGREAAWLRFMERFRSPLRQAAVGITGSSSLGEDLADSLYAELYGMTERDGQRRSPLASYGGRGSLMGWLRTTLAQRHVDYHRRTHREAPLPEFETAHEASEAFAAPQAEATASPAQLAELSGALQQVLASLSAEERFLLSAYFLDQRTLADIGKLLRVHEATISRKLKRLTADVQKQLLKRLQALGLSRRAAEEALGVDPRDLTLNLRSLLQSPQETAFLSQRHKPPTPARVAAERGAP